LSVFYTYFHDRQQRIRGFLASLGSIVMLEAQKIEISKRKGIPKQAYTLA